MRKLLYTIRLPEYQPPYYEAYVIENSVPHYVFTAETWFDLVKKAEALDFEEWQLELLRFEHER